MILTNLKVCDFRSFRGTHSLTLSTCSNRGKSQPVVLVGGLNGAGKTTLFLAIKLALFGRATGEGGYTSTGYASFIRSCIHRYPQAILQPNEAFVELEFQYGKQGKEFTYTVQRTWEFVGSKFIEQLKILENGEEQTLLDQCEAQELLDELVPSGIFNLFFFDGEKIELLAKDSTGEILREAFESLYGLNLIERLRNDLKTYLRKNATPLLNVAVDTGNTQKEYALVRSELTVARSERQRLRDTLEKTQFRKQQLEVQLRANGGMETEGKHSLYFDAKDLSHTLEHKKKLLRETIGGLFPLSLVGNTLQNLYHDVSADFEASMQRHANSSIEHFAQAVRTSLNREGQQSLDEVLVNWLSEHRTKDCNYDLSPRTLARLEQVVKVDAKETLKQCEGLCKAIESDFNRLEQLEHKLSRERDEDTLELKFNEYVSVVEKITEAHREIATLHTETKAKLKQAIRLGNVLSDRHRDAIKQLDRTQSLEYAERIRELLKTYRETIITRKIDQLEREFDNEFCLLSRKNRSEFRIQIDPDSFKVSFQSLNRGEFSVTQLSEGEKHIFAVAMLVALAKTSLRPLPLVIDSPLGRLDSEHNKNLIRDYFPSASHQVILFSTDEEIDEKAYKDLSSRLSRSYLIEFDDVQHESSLVNGYFTNNKEKE